MKEIQVTIKECTDISITIKANDPKFSELFKQIKDYVQSYEIEISEDSDQLEELVMEHLTKEIIDQHREELWAEWEITCDIES